MFTLRNSSFNSCRFFFSAALLISLVLLFSLAGAEARHSVLCAEEGLAGVPSLLVSHYEVQGVSADEIRAELDKLGPLDLSGRRRDAYTLWHISWCWPLRNDGQAEFARTVSNCEIRVTLPRLKRGLVFDGGLLEQWDAFYQAVLWHELKHLEIVLRNYSRVAEVIKAAYGHNSTLSVMEANMLGRRVLEEIREQDRRLDELTQNGRLEGVRFP